MVERFRTAAKSTRWDSDSYPVGFHTYTGISSDARCESNSPSTGACLQLWSQTLFLIPPWSRRQNLETGGPERAAPSNHQPGRKLRWGRKGNIRSLLWGGGLNTAGSHEEDRVSESLTTRWIMQQSLSFSSIRSQPFGVLVD